MRVTNISKSFTHKMAAITSWHRYMERNDVTVTLCIHGDVNDITESMITIDRHFVGIHSFYFTTKCDSRKIRKTRHTALSEMAKIYRVTQMKLNQLVSENVHMITDLP